MKKAIAAGSLGCHTNEQEHRHYTYSQASNAEAADIELPADEDRLLTDTAGRFTPITGPAAMLDLDLGPRQQPLRQPGARHVDFDRLDPTLHRSSWSDKMF